MLRITALSMAILSCLSVLSQNLVPNCSFEDTIACPDDYGQIDSVNGWSSFRNSPDYFNSCAPYDTIGNMGAPNNSFGFQAPATGNAYAGLFTYASFDYREYMGAELIQPLIISQKYYIAFKINLPESGAYDKIWTAGNKAGVLFTTVQFDMTNPIPTNNFAHFYTDSTITNTSNWTSISGWFTADSAYRYIALGNFFNNTNTDTTVLYGTIPGWDAGAYYYIDDICVAVDSTKCNCDSLNGVAEILKDPFEIFPNPARDVFQINGHTGHLKVEVYNILGQLQNTWFLETNERTVSVANLFSGLYVVRMESCKNSMTKKIIVTH